MKCSQKLCQRTKHISSSGNCNVCEDVIETLRKANEAKIKKSNFEKVELDLKLMVDTHKKLLSGSQVDPEVVNTLLLGGVVNILIHSEAIDDIEEKVRDLQREDCTNKAKIEYLENWVIKQNNTLEELSEKITRLDENGFLVKESGNIEYLKKKVTNVEIDVGNKISKFEITLRQVQADRRIPANKNPHKKPNIKCAECEETFTKTCDLELHMEEHGKVKQFKCQVCRQEFYLKWRYQKHIKMHTEMPKPCKFFRSKTQCPFDKIGCMFLHVEEAAGEDTSNEDYEEDLAEDQCHLCMKPVENQEQLMQHFEENHDGFYNSMMINISDKLSLTEDERRIRGVSYA